MVNVYENYLDKKSKNVKGRRNYSRRDTEMKASEGVNVLLLVWDDITSDEVLKRDGIMSTHDQETKNYVNNTYVHYCLCPRNADSEKTVIQEFQVGVMFTHHQMTIVVDTEIPGGMSDKRMIKSFLGDGRCDTRDHSLFRTLETIHRQDFYQHIFQDTSIAKGGPREPWHHIHCRLEGTIAWDVLSNFEQTWRKQIGNRFIYSMNEFDKFIIHPMERETWNVQIFRFIDGGVVTNFPVNPEEAYDVGLFTGIENVIDHSIPDAYISAIRRAKIFIYIANQYFIEKHLSFASYPKGDLTQDSEQDSTRREICSLHCYSNVAKRFAKMESRNNVYRHMQFLEVEGNTIVGPREYLTFFYLGNHE
uniref:Phospholipase D n=1 Tax=Solanum lycopersicum TaxID=4081 RepID=A0A3Q7IHX6_SOLLC